MINFKLGSIPSPKDKRYFLITRLIAPVNIFPNELLSW
jgi:hypothetical protein